MTPIYKDSIYKPLVLMCWYIIVDAKLQPPLHDLGIRLVQYFSPELDVIGINFLPKKELKKSDLGMYSMMAAGVIFMTDIREDIVTAAFLDAINHEYTRLRNNLIRRD